MGPYGKATGTGTEPPLSSRPACADRALFAAQPSRARAGVSQQDRLPELLAERFCTWEVVPGAEPLAEPGAFVGLATEGFPKRCARQPRRPRLNAAPGFLAVTPCHAPM